MFIPHISQSHTFYWPGQRLLKEPLGAESTFEGGDGVSGTIALSGTILPGATEAEIVAGGETLIITLTDDTWAAAGAVFNNQRQAIIDGCTSIQSELTGWNNEVRDNEIVGAVVRTSDTVVTITWTAAASYDISSIEEITVTIPSAALVTSPSEVIASPIFSILPLSVGAAGLVGITGIADIFSLT
jgi:hypothetical protein